MQRLIFSGHETFHCRILWLKKGYDFISQGYSFKDDEAVVKLGVGKNMVSAIQFWMKAFNLWDQNNGLTDFAKKVFSDDGYDPYQEKHATAWLLHWNLVTSDIASIYSIVFNEFRTEKPEFSKDHLLSHIKYKCDEIAFTFNETTISNDIGVFLRTYHQPSGKTKSFEDDYSGVLQELKFVDEVSFREGSNKFSYKLESKQREDLPYEIFLYTVLDNNSYGDSIAFTDLLNRPNSPGSVFALTADGLKQKIDEVVSSYPSHFTYTDNAGIRELQKKKKLDQWKVLEKFYTK